MTTIDNYIKEQRRRRKDFHDKRERVEFTKEDKIWILLMVKTSFIHFNDGKAEIYEERDRLVDKIITWIKE